MRGLADMHHVRPGRRVGATAGLAVAAAVTVTALAASPTFVAGVSAHESRTAPAAAAPGEPVELPPDDPAFYTVPDPLPAGTHGDLIRFQLADEGINLTYRIMYLSERRDGTPIAVTGLVVMSDDPAPFGGYHVLLHGHAATGLADQCAPSTAVGTSGSAVDIDLDYESFESLVSMGFALVATDYAGLGVPGDHPFLDGASTARSMLDAGRAARQLPVLYAGAKTAVTGISEGGQAALWAAELAPAWTPEQPIVAGLVASAATELTDLARAGVVDPARQDVTVAMLLGQAAADPEARAALDTILSPMGTQLAGLLATECSLEEVSLPPTPFLLADPTTVEPFASLFAANTAGTVANDTPMLVFHGDADTVVPLAQSDALLDRLCTAGQVVERRVVPGATHATTVSSATIEGREWLAAIAAGTLQPTTSCLP